MDEPSEVAAVKDEWVALIDSHDNKLTVKNMMISKDVAMSPTSLIERYNLT